MSKHGGHEDGDLWRVGLCLIVLWKLDAFCLRPVMISSTTFLVWQGAYPWYLQDVHRGAKHLLELPGGEPGEM